MTESTSNKMAVERLKNFIIEELSEDKAENIVDVDLVGKTDLADYMIVATGRGNKHISSMADKLADKLTREGYGGIIPEGQPQSNWILIDAYDVIVHLFTEEARDMYKLEELWQFNFDRK
ncbi:Ribosomal silencing factor RsfS [Candidatus Arcanobacter lacustris]|jgi:ribosome-associated protein|uniref:Ribosomal silencing factor RsfS n=1 Tax=Candidatus Arcanibacter lacustris TaxID=1607817 RepID=A0A0F5MS00_9RICK|nr:Ribosomal silencing factor RsfS [Candidatus Arcanobacter lacustris]